MANRQSYPSPSASATRAGAGPFYSNNPSLPTNADLVDHAELEMTAEKVELQQHDQFLADFNAQITNSNINPDLQPHTTHPQEASILAHHYPVENLAREAVLSLNQQDVHDSNTYSLPSQEHMPQPATPGPSSNNLGMPTASRARTKVSRACDECRRKKVPCPSARLVPRFPY
jgi:hypothetical protein